MQVQARRLWRQQQTRTGPAEEDLRGSSCCMLGNAGDPVCTATSRLPVSQTTSAAVWYCCRLPSQFRQALRYGNVNAQHSPRNVCHLAEATSGWEVLKTRRCKEAYACKYQYHAKVRYHCLYASQKHPAWAVPGMNRVFVILHRLQGEHPLPGVTVEVVCCDPV